MSDTIKINSKEIFTEYKNGTEFKTSIGEKGIFEQSKINERFYVGDQWYGAKCGNDRPLCRRNIIKRIADFKLSSIAPAPIAVNYSAEGVPDNSGMKDKVTKYKEGIKSGADFADETDDVEISVIMSVLSDYFRTTAERVKFDFLKEKALRNAYISGTGIIFTYWDEQTKTGLYADDKKEVAIKGDIAVEVLNVENIVFGDPNCESVQKQPYIIILQRLNCEAVKREARRNSISVDEIEKIKPDNADAYTANAGTRGEDEPTDSRRVTVLTKFYKEWNENDDDYRVMCVKCCENAYIKEPWDTGLRMYPIAKMSWNTRNSSAYGDSDISYQIPNQIAINRAISAEIWAIMTTGMPKTIINGDTVTEGITNNPGEIIKVYGTNEDVAGAIKHVAPPPFSSQLIGAINDLANNTLSDNGANDAALGNIRPDNAAAIIQMREASLQPMQLHQNRFYSFIEDIARIWCDFWLHLYGKRRLKIEDKDGSYYIPFDPKRYENLLITAKIDVGSNPVWNISTQVAMMDGLRAAQIINDIQYLERLPEGVIPDKTGLIQEKKEELAAQQMAMQQQMMAETMQEVPTMPPRQDMSLNPEEVGDL